MRFWGASASCAAASAGLGWLLLKHVPASVRTFESAGLELPMSTQVVVDVSRWSVRSFPLALMLLIVIVLLAKRLMFGKRARPALVARLLAVATPALGAAAVAELAAIVIVVYALRLPTAVPAPVHLSSARLGCEGRPGAEAVLDHAVAGGRAQGPPLHSEEREKRGLVERSPGGSSARWPWRA